MQIAFVLDIIIAVLLVLTITYAVRLNQRLGQLRKDKNELQELAKTFADATIKAEAGIEQLKISSDELQIDFKKAEALRDDLAYLVDRGGRTADQMVKKVQTPKALSPEERADKEEDLLIEEAIRAATPGAGRASKDRRPGGLGAGLAAGPDMGPDTRTTTRRISGRPEPTERQMGAGLGGLSEDDRLLGEPFLDRGSEPKSVGDTDAARELLKALSAVK